MQAGEVAGGPLQVGPVIHPGAYHNLGVELDAPGDQPLHLGQHVRHRAAK